MPNIIFSEGAELNNAKLGKLLTPLKAIIEHESDLQQTKGGVVDSLYNVEKSYRFAETIVVQDTFDTFTPTAEGGKGDVDGVVETGSNVISHVEFKKDFVITRAALDDSVHGIGADTRAKLEAFTRAYYLTKNKVATAMIANGASASFKFGGYTLKPLTADGKQIWHKAHDYGSADGHVKGTQANYFYTARAAAADLTLADVEKIIMHGAEKLRMMKSENGEPLGYVADTIVIPGNTPYAELFLRQALGSELQASNGNNAINIQYGKYNVVILPSWEAAANTYPFVILSSEANKNLMGNMFFERTALDIKNWEDGNTRNWNWNGYCRFGVGFGSYKHMVRIDSIANGSTIATAEALTL